MVKCGKIWKKSSHKNYISFLCFIFCVQYVGSDLINPLAAVYDFTDRKVLNRELKKATLIINATTVGMTPNLTTLIDEREISSLTQKMFFRCDIQSFGNENVKYCKKI